VASWPEEMVMPKSSRDFLAEAREQLLADPSQAVMRADWAAIRASVGSPVANPNEPDFRDVQLLAQELAHAERVRLALERLEQEEAELVQLVAQWQEADGSEKAVRANSLRPLLIARIGQLSQRGSVSIRGGRASASEGSTIEDLLDELDLMKLTLLNRAISS